MKYSFKIGLRKGLETALLTSLAVVAMVGVADQDLWALAEQYVQPYLSGVTVAGVITMVMNYVKIKRKGG